MQNDPVELKNEEWNIFRTTCLVDQRYPLDQVDLVALVDLKFKRNTSILKKTGQTGYQLIICLVMVEDLLHKIKEK